MVVIRGSVAPGGASAGRWEGIGGVCDDQQRDEEVDESGNFIVQCRERCDGGREHMARRCPSAMETTILTDQQGLKSMGEIRVTPYLHVGLGPEA